jgi:hypothetical protein
MPFCPKCRYEYRPGFTRCADCDVDLVDKLPEETEKPHAGDEWIDLICIETYPLDAPALTAQAVLRAQGINASLQNSIMSQADMFLVFADGGVRLMVPKEDAARAKAILAQK